MPRLTEESTYQDACIFAQHIVIAIDCLDQSRAMDKIFSDPEFSSRYKDAPHFFRTAYHAMRFRFEIEVDKLFDPKSKSFGSFKNRLIQNNMKKNSILEKCAVPLLRLRTDGSGEKEKIRTALKGE